MRQIWITQAGGPEVLEVRSAPDPTPAPGQIRVRVKFSGVNFADITARMGQYPDAPKIPCVVGYEVSGVVDEAGAGVEEFKTGDEVLGFTRFGGYSDVVVEKAEYFVHKPCSLSWEKAAAIPVNYLTAWIMLVRMGSLAEGDMVLIHAVAGGVGQAALQICQWKGADVVGTASPSKHARLKELGVKRVIDYTSVNVERALMDYTHNRGVDIILDSLGGRSFRQSYRCLAPMGRLCMFGASSFAPDKTRSLFTIARGLVAMPFFHPLGLIDKNKAVIGCNMGHLWEELPRLRTAIREILELVEEGVLEPVVDRSFSFEEAGKAHEYIQDRKNFGKVLLEP